MNTNLSALLVSGALASSLAATGALAQEVSKKPEKLSDFMVDITGGVVSASNMAGVDASLVQKVQTAQDVVVAIKPLTSGANKPGIGLAITPARTTILPMSTASYEDNFNRFLAGITLSVAKGETQLSGVSYARKAASMDVVYYLKKSDDPIIAANDAFSSCREKSVVVAEVRARLNQMVQDQASKADRDAYVSSRQAAVRSDINSCMDEAAGARSWNAARVSASLGKGYIKGPGGSDLSVGSMWTINSTLPAGTWGALLLTARGVRDGLDLKTIATTPVFTSSTLYAVRLEMGSHEDAKSLRKGRYLVEVSNAASKSATAFAGMFKYAVGADYNVGRGAWLELRLGRSRAVTNGQMETQGLLTFNISSLPTLFAN